MAINVGVQIPKQDVCAGVRRAGKSFFQLTGPFLHLSSIWSLLLYRRNIQNKNVHLQILNEVLWLNIFSQPYYWVQRSSRSTSRQTPLLVTLMSWRWQCFLWNVSGIPEKPLASTDVFASRSDPFLEKPYFEQHWLLAALEKRLTFSLFLQDSKIFLCNARWFLLREIQFLIGLYSLFRSVTLGFLLTSINLQK